MTPRAIGRRSFSLLLLASTLLGARATLAAQVSREYEIKAAYLYNFVKFVDWPSAALPDSSSTVSICVLGEDPFGSFLDSLRDNVVKGRRLTIKRVMRSEGLPSCNLLFISSSERKRMTEVVASLGTASVLTVGDMENFTELGGMITLVTTRDNHVHVHSINRDATDRARLRIDSRLLNVARVKRSVTSS